MHIMYSDQIHSLYYFLLTPLSSFQTVFSWLHYYIFISVCMYVCIFYHIHNEVLISHEEESNYVIFRKMDGTSNHHVK
jgi:hypothetical protein